MTSGHTKWIDQDVLRRLFEPTLETGLVFVVESTAHLIFLVCLIFYLQEMSDCEHTLAVRSAVLPLITPTDPISSVEDVSAFLTSALISDFGNVVEGSVFGIVGQQLLAVGAIQLLQHRSESWQCTATTKCFSMPSNNPDPFLGYLQDVNLQRLSESCVNPIVCGAGVVSQRSGRSYSYGGLVLPYFNQTFYASKILSLNYTTEIMKSFVDASSRFVSMSLAIVSVDTSIASQVSINFELPVSGGVYSWTSVRSMPTKDGPNEAFFAGVFWTYAAIAAATEVGRFILTLRRNIKCVACRYGSTSEKSTFGTSCAGCGKAIVIDAAETTSCGFCNVSIPPIRHTCFRSHFNVAKLVVLVNVLLLICGYLMARVAVSSARDDLSRALATPAPVLISLSSPIDLYDIATSIASVNLILAFVGIYRFLGRLDWSAQFLRVFSSAGVLTLFFFVGYTAVFVGFALCFHLLLAEIAGSFTTFQGAISGLFAILLGYVDWQSITSEASGVFFATFMIFCWLCILVMANILISLLTVEYKRAIKVKVYDLEAASLKLLLEKCGQVLRRTNKAPDEQKKAAGESCEQGNKDKTLLSDERGSDLVSLPEQEAPSALEELSASLQALSNSLGKSRRTQDRRLNALEQKVTSLALFTTVCSDL